MKPSDVLYKALIIDDIESGNKPPLNIKVLTRLLERRDYYVDFCFHQFVDVGKLKDYLVANSDFDLILFDVVLESDDNKSNYEPLFDSLESYRKNNRLAKTILFSSLVDEDNLKGLDIQISGSLLLRWVNDYRVNGICPRNEEYVSDIICKCIREIDPVTMNLVNILNTYQHEMRKVFIAGNLYSTSELIYQIRAQSDVGQEFVTALTRMMIAQYSEPEE